MSVEAISWALTQAAIPRDRRDASSLAIVLVGLANHAGPDGRNAFPAISTLSRYTRLSERSVQYALRTLEELELIHPSDPDIVAAYVKRADRRPRGWDLALDHAPGERSPRSADRPPRDVDSPRGEVQSLHPGQPHGVQRRQNGVQTATSRGAERAPDPSMNHPGTTPARQSAAADRAPAPPQPCGHCDGRPGEPVTARVVWLDETRSVPCPRCNPRSPGYPATTQAS